MKTNISAKICIKKLARKDVHLRKKGMVEKKNNYKINMRAPIHTRKFNICHKSKVIDTTYWTTKEETLIWTEK